MKRVKIDVWAMYIMIKYDFIQIQAKSIGEFLFSFKNLPSPLATPTLKGAIDAINSIGITVDLKIHDTRPFYEKDWVDIKSGEYLAK